MKTLIVIVSSILFTMWCVGWFTKNDTDLTLELRKELPNPISSPIVGKMNNSLNRDAGITSTDDSVSWQADNAERLQNVGPILDADLFIEDRSGVEPVNTGEIIDADTYTDNELGYSEPQDVGLPLDADSELALQIEYTEAQNMGDIIDVDNDYSESEEYRSSKDLGPALNADDYYNNL